MNNVNWILKNGLETIDCVSFPFAFRAAFHIVRKGVEAKQNRLDLVKKIMILGPKNGKGERKSYSYAAAEALATEQGLLTEDGINSREFKKKK